MHFILCNLSMLPTSASQYKSVVLDLSSLFCSKETFPAGCKTVSTVLKCAQDGGTF